MPLCVRGPRRGAARFSGCIRGRRFQRRGQGGGGGWGRGLQWQPSGGLVGGMHRLLICQHPFGGRGRRGGGSRVERPREGGGSCVGL